MAMKESDYIRLEFAENNRKEKVIVLTPSGEEYISSLVASMDKVEKSMSEKMGDEKQFLLANLLIDYGDIIKQEIISD